MLLVGQKGAGMMADLNVGGAAGCEGFPGRTPRGWNPERAVTFFQAIRCIDHFLDYHVPLSVEMVVLIFYHETAFSDARQMITNKQGVDVPEGSGIGFGQIEVKNSDKPRFFKAVFQDPYDNGPFDADEMIDRILEDEEFAIQVHCEYLKFLHHNQVLENPSLDGDEPLERLSATKALLMGQFGEKNKDLIPPFMTAEPALRAALENGAGRKSIIDALNKCGRSIPLEPPFIEYWDFTLPDEDLPAISKWYDDPYH
jgi:hypothetical protein